MKAGSNFPGRGGSLLVQRVRAARTRQSLIETATPLFGAKGFHGTSTPELVAAASVTRGALYHHFEGKEGLFEAVFADALRELNEGARDSVKIYSDDVWTQFTGALVAYLRRLADRPDLRRIVLTDGPVVLGWGHWHAMHAEWVQAGVEETLERLHDRHELKDVASRPLAILIQGAINEAAMAIAHSTEPTHITGELTAGLRSLLEGLRRS